MLGPLDEYPVHQVPQPIAWPGSSDRNFYDRSYFNAHDRTGDIVGCAIVNNHTLPVRQSLVLKRIERLSKKVRNAIGGHDHGDAGHAGE